MADCIISTSDAKLTIHSQVHITTYFFFLSFENSSVGSLIKKIITLPVCDQAYKSVTNM